VKTLKVLIVEDEVIIAWDLKRSIEDLGNEVLPIASSADKAVEAARRGEPDLILMDVVLKGPKSGIEAAREIRSFSSAAIIYLTGNAQLIDAPLMSETRALGLYAKPPSDLQLLEMITLACEEGGRA
jgi:CheY-like chemotaxis protein